MKECVILAGGFGTRLQSVVNDRPKCMALVAEEPFLKHIFDFLEKENFSHVILSLGYKSEIVIDWLEIVNYPFAIDYVIEKEPLGTGGAIKFATTKSESDSFYVFNGDTFFAIKTQGFEDFHANKESHISLALKPMSDFDRYGAVEVGEDDRIIKFKEKKFQEEGLINGGVYLINKSVLNDKSLPTKFSFEKDILEAKLNDLSIYGFSQNRYFIDIGIPSDYEKANVDFLEDDYNRK